MIIFQDYYAILEIPFDASDTAIRKAYLKQATLWHPDKNPGHNTHDKMALINEAYVILHDPETRTRYNKEYLQHKKNVTTMSKNIFTNQHTMTDENTIEDDVLKEWIAKAKAKANELNEFSLNDIMGMCSAATSGCITGILYGLVTIFICYILLLLGGAELLALLELLMVASGLLAIIFFLGKRFVRFVRLVANKK